MLFDKNVYISFKNLIINPHIDLALHLGISGFEGKIRANNRKRFRVTESPVIIINREFGS